MIDIDSAKAKLAYNPDSGVLTWISTGKPAGYKPPNGYIQVRLNRKLCLAHRLAWAIFYGKMPDGDIDHINGCPADNRISNLRDVSHSVNLQNRQRAKKNTHSGLIGASIDRARGGYLAYIHHGGKQIYIGRFKTAEEASAAYIAKKRTLHEGCTI